MALLDICPKLHDKVESLYSRHPIKKIPHSDGT